MYCTRIREVSAAQCIICLLAVGMIKDCLQLRSGALRFISIRSNKDGQHRLCIAEAELRHMQAPPLSVLTIQVDN